MSTGSVKAAAMTVVEINVPVAGNKGTITGLCAYKNNEVVLNLIFKSSVNAYNSPGLIALNSVVGKPIQDCALSCIDISNGISSSITGNIPAGIGSNGVVYIKECAIGATYAITGTYIRAKTT